MARRGQFGAQANPVSWGQSAACCRRALGDISVPMPNVIKACRGERPTNVSAPHGSSDDIRTHLQGPLLAVSIRGSTSNASKP